MRRTMILLLCFLTLPAYGQTQRVPKTSTFRIAVDNLDDGVTDERPLPVTQTTPAKITERRKFGFNSAVGTTAEVVTSLSTTSFGGQLQAATAARVKAGGDANDTAAGSGAQKVMFLGLDDSLNEVQEEVTTAGALASAATTATARRWLRAYVTEAGTYAGSNAGNIVIEDSGGTVDLLQIDAGEGQTESCFDTIPAGKTGKLKGWTFFIEGVKEATLKVYQLPAVDDTSTPFAAKRVIARAVGVTGFGHETFPVPITLAEKTDVWVEATASTGTVAVSATLWLEWEDQ